MGTLQGAFSKLSLAVFATTLTACNVSMLSTSRGPGGGSSTDPLPTLSIQSNLTLQESVAVAVFTVGVSQAVTSAVSVDYATVSGSAVPPGDYVSKTGTVSFLPGGPLTQSISVAINNDSLDEPNETFHLMLHNPVGLVTVQVPATASATIEDDDDEPTFSLSSSSTVSVGEGVGTVSFTVALSAAPPSAVSVEYATANGTATAGADYVAKSGTLTFQPTDPLTKTFTVTVSEDVIDELDETFTVTLSNPSTGSLLGTPVMSTVTIQDNDVPSFTISSATSVSASEAAANVSFTVALSANPVSAVTVNYATANGTATAGADYVARSGTLTFSPGGALTQTVVVNLTEDTADESDETFTFTISSASVGSTLGTPVMSTVTIQDNDVPSFTISSATSVSASEAAANVSFTVALSANPVSAVTVNYATANGTATAGADYVARSGTLTFSPGGALTQTVVVNLTEDTADESDETFTFTISSASVGSTLGTPVMSTVTIQDNDVPSFTISSATSVSASEAAANVSFTVALSANPVSAVTVNYATANGTATAGADYVARSGTLTFSPGGALTQTVVVNLTEDTADESDETFTFTISSASVGSTLGTPVMSTVTIQDNDVPSFTISSATSVSTSEAAANVSFTVALSANPVSAVTVNYATANGTATAGADYVARSGTLTFSPGGALTQTVVVNLTEDTADESDETFTFTISSASAGSMLGTPVMSTVTIQDNDVPSFTISSATSVSASEAAANVSFTVALSANPVSAVTVNYATANGTATAGADYVARSGTLTFSPGGALTQTVVVNLTEDTADESDETFTFTISSASAGSMLGTPVMSTVTIQDNDVPSFTISSATSVSASEAAANVSFTVALSANPVSAVTVNYATANGTATAGADYVARSGTLTFSPGGALTQTVVVNLTEDTADESDETFTFTISSASVGSTLGTPVMSTVTIQDNDVPSFTISSATSVSASEAAANVSFTVALSANPVSAVTVNYATANGTATAGADYVARSGTLTFSPGGALTQTVVVNLTEDTADESDETFTFTISSASAGSTLGTPVMSTVTIQDNDLASVGPASVTGLVGWFKADALPVVASGTALASWADSSAENATASRAGTAAGLSYQGNVINTKPVVRFNGTNDYMLADGVASALTGSNSMSVFYVAKQTSNAATYVWSAHQSNSTADVARGGFANNTTYRISTGNTGSSTSYQFSDTVPTANFGIYSTILESNSVYLARDGVQKISAAITPAGAPVPYSAAAKFSLGQEYDGATTPSDFFQGDLAELIVYDQAVSDADQRKIEVYLSEKYALPLYYYSVSISNATVAEETATMQFTVNITPTPDETVTVKYATANGTATSGSDYQAIALTDLTFDPGESQHTIDVFILNDNVPESTETFSVVLSQPSAYTTISQATGTGTITDGDAVVAACWVNDQPASQTWTGAAAVQAIDFDFGGNGSGLTYQPATANHPAYLWAVRNGPTVIDRFVESGTNNWIKDPNGWANGLTINGGYDTEGLTKAEWEDDYVYVAPEKQGTTVQFNVLKMGVGTSNLSSNPVMVWDLGADFVGVINPATDGNNVGFEAITWAPDTFLVANGFRKSDGTLYNPADYPLHGTGLFFIGLEKNGYVYVYALNSNGTFARIQVITSATIGMSRNMGLEFDRETGLLWANCDQGCNNAIAVLELNGGYFTRQKMFNPTTAIPNYNNEGIAMAPESTCVNGRKKFYWINDSNDGARAIRVSDIACGPICD